MEGIKRESYRLRIKGSAGMQQPRPDGSTHGNCVICGRFVEALKPTYERDPETGRKVVVAYERCGTPECQDLLKKVCLDRGLGMQAAEGMDLWTIIRPEVVIQEGHHWLAEQETHALDNNTCPCGRALKLPREDHCALCHREHGQVRLQERRQKKLADRKARRKAQAAKPINKIKGLDKLK